MDTLKKPYPPARLPKAVGSGDDGGLRKGIKPPRALLQTLLLMTAIFTLGWADNWDTLKSSVGTITSVQAAFRQEKHLAILAGPLISHGRFTYRSPGSLRWEYREPVQSVLLMHGGKISRFVKGADGFRQESGGGMEAMQVVMDQIALWMTGRFDESAMFDPHLDNTGRITLTPKDDHLKAFIESIEIRMTQEPGIIDDVVIYESEDAYTRMRFTDTVLNGKIDDAVFRKPQ